MRINSNLKKLFIIGIIFLFVGSFIFFEIEGMKDVNGTVDYKYSRIEGKGHSSSEVFILNINNTEYSILQEDYVKIKVGDKVKIKDAYANNSNFINDVVLL